MAGLPYLRPFILETKPISPTRVDEIDLYLPSRATSVRALSPSKRRPEPVEGGLGSAPLVVLVHGGPMRTPPEEPPSRWPVYQGYAQLLCANLIAVAMFDHGLISGDKEAAAAQLQAAIETGRSAEGVDGSRVVLWFFSGGGVLSPPFLRRPPDSLRGISFSYPVLDHDEPDWNPRAALRSGITVPLLLTQVGREIPRLVDGQREFIDRASQLGVPLKIIGVPDGGHGFDCAEPTRESQAAVERAIRWIVSRI